MKGEKEFASWLVGGMSLQNISYIFTITGGGWETYHELYAITTDKKVLYADRLGVEPEHLFDLETELDFETHDSKVGFDAPSCTMFKVVDGLFGKHKRLKKLYSVGMYKNTPAVDTICHLHYSILRQKEKDHE